MIASRRIPNTTTLFHTKQEFITPNQARVILRTHEQAGGTNRTLRKSWVADLAIRMKAGQWLATHQGIAIAPDGVLLDGQHRLLALIAANIDGILVNVSRGIDPGTRDGYDGGSPRINADHLAVSKHEAAACNFIQRILMYPYPIGKTSVQDARAIWEWAGSYIQVSAPKNSSKFSSSAIVIAMASQIMRAPKQRAELISRCQAFYRIDFENMTPSMRSLSSQMVNGGCSARNNPMDLFFRAWRAFDPQYWDRTLIRLPERAPALQSIRATYAACIVAHRP